MQYRVNRADAVERKYLNHKLCTVSHKVEIMQRMRLHWCVATATAAVAVAAAVDEKKGKKKIH